MSPRLWSRTLPGVVGLALLGALALPRPALAADFVPSGGDWRTLTTRHFWVHYPSELREVALKTAQYAEESHAVLGSMFHREDDRTHVTILDTEDTTNGFATPYPDSSLTFWVTPPSPEEDWYVGRYDNWLKMIIAHEYTHVLHLRSATGPGQINGWINASVLRFLLPEFAVLLQLDFLPNFLKEGLAVFQESALTGGGRAIEGQFDMVLRRQFLEGAPFSIDKASGNYALEWAPGGALYSYGTIFHKYLAAKGGIDQAVRISDRLGEFPWAGINVAALRATGKPMYRLWDDAVAFFRDRYARQVEAIRRRPLTSSRLLTTTGRNHRHPHWLDAATLLYTQSPLEDEVGVVRHDLATGKTRFVLAKSSRKDFRVVPGGKKLVFYGAGESPRLTSFTDAFTHDLEAGATRPLTRGLRASCPAPHPDGRTLVVLNGGGRNDLAMLDPEGKVQWRLKGPMLGSFASPVWHPDGRRAVLVQWQEGRTNLVWLDAETRKLTPVVPDDAVQIAPCVSPDGRWVVYASDRTGVMNLHAIRLADGARFQVTNVLGGAFDPEVSPDGRQLAFVDYGPKGYDVHVMPFDPASFTPEGKGRGEGLFRGLDGDPVVMKPLQASSAQSSASVTDILSDAPYNPLQSLQPRLVWPFAFFDHTTTLLRDLRLPGGDLGGFGHYMALRGYGEDALRRQFWFASLGVTSVLQPDTPMTPFIQGAFQSDEWDPTLAISYSQVSEPSLIVNGGRVSQPLLAVDSSGKVLAQYLPGDTLTPTLFQARTTQSAVGSIQLDPPPNFLISPWQDGMTTKIGFEWKRLSSSVMLASQSIPDAVLIEGQATSLTGQSFPVLVPAQVPPSDFYIARVNLLGNSAFRPGRPISLTDGALWNVGLERTLPQVSVGGATLGSMLGYTRAFADWRRYVALPGRHVLAFRGFAGTLFDDRAEVPYARNNFGWYAADLASSVNQADPNAQLLMGRATSTALYDLQDLRVLQDSPDRKLPLRGYAVGTQTPVGQHAAFGSLEWRIPLGEIMTGPGTVPVFIERLSFAPFVDLARVWTLFAESQEMWGVGAELRTHVTLAQGIPSQLRLGYGRGLHPALGAHQLILGLGANF